MVIEGGAGGAVMGWRGRGGDGVQGLHAPLPMHNLPHHPSPTV